MPQERLEQLAERCGSLLARSPAARAAAPGRVNWIGEHTDYNGGLVLPCAIDRHVVAALALREDGRVRVCSRERGVGELMVSDPSPRGDWLDYVRGVIAALAERGLRPPGADLALAASLPAEAGLSSSAALGLAVATAFDAALRLGLDARERAALAHRAETVTVGVPCGWMDPLVSSLGRAGHLLRIDCRSLELRPLPLPPGGALLVAHSGVERSLAAGGYAARRAECQQALAAARRLELVPPRGSLSDLRSADLPRLAKAVEAPLLGRARHVVNENERVEATCRALAEADFRRAGALLREGMRSLRDDFEVSVPELDALCALGDATPGVFGSRLTGAGFGGCTLHLVAEEAAGAVALALAEGFAARFGRRPPVWLLRASDGARALPG